MVYSNIVDSNNQIDFLQVDYKKQEEFIDVNVIRPLEIKDYSQRLIKLIDKKTKYSPIISRTHEFLSGHKIPKGIEVTLSVNSKYFDASILSNLFSKKFYPIKENSDLSEILIVATNGEINFENKCSEFRIWKKPSLPKRDFNKLAKILELEYLLHPL